MSPRRSIPAPVDPLHGPSNDEVMAAFVGPGWLRHYQPSFARRARGEWFAFNWAAALVPLWLAWRGFWALQLLAWALGGALLAAASWLADALEVGWPTLAVAATLIAVVQGLTGDALVHRRARRTIRRVRARQRDSTAALRELRALGDVSIVMPVLLAAAMAVTIWQVPELARARPGTSDRTALRTDLRYLAIVEEAWFAAHHHYTDTPPDSGPRAFVPSIGTQVIVGTATATGWSATAHRVAGGRLVCGIAMGDAASPIPGAAPGEPACN